MKDLLFNDIHELYKKVSKAEKVIVISHSNPDGDATGSSIAMLRWLLSLGKDAHVILPSEYPDTLEYLVSEDIKSRIIISSEDPQKGEKVIKEADFIICLDFNQTSRIGDLEEQVFSKTADKVLIDHHPGPEREHFSICFSETEISSTSELSYYILMKMPGIDDNAKNLPPRVGEALLTGMTTDTNNFANSVFSTTLIMTSELLAAGVDRETILDNLFQKHKLSRIKLMGHLLAHCLNVTPDGVAYMVMMAKTARKYNIQDGDTEGFVNIPLSVGDVRMSIFAREESDRFRISIRSKKGTSSNACARQYFNGGGHELASGGRLMFCDGIRTEEQVRTYIEDVTHKFFEGQKQ